MSAERTAAHPHKLEVRAPQEQEASEVGSLPDTQEGRDEGRVSSAAKMSPALTVNPAGQPRITPLRELRYYPSDRMVVVIEKRRLPRSKGAS